MKFLSDSRLRYAATLQFFAGGTLIAIIGFVYYELLTGHSSTILSYFYFLNQIFALAIFIFSKKRIEDNPSRFANGYYTAAICLHLLFFFLLGLNNRWIGFISAVILSPIQMMVTPIVANTITLSLDSREFRQAGWILLLAFSLGGIFFGSTLPFYIHFFGGRAILPILAFFYLVCLCVSQKLTPLYEPEKTQMKQTKPLQNELLRYLTGYAIILYTFFILSDYILRYSMQQYFQGTQIAIISSIMAGVVCLFMGIAQLSRLEWVINKLGIAKTLMILPLIAVGAGILIIIFPSFLLIAILCCLLFGVMNTYNYVAYNSLLNALPVNVRLFGRSIIFIVAKVISTAGIAAVILWLLGSYATPRIVSFFIIGLGLLSLLFIIPIKKQHKRYLKKYTEKRSYEIYEHLLGDAMDPERIPQLMSDILTSSHPINDSKRITKLCRIDDIGVEKALLKLLESPSQIIQNALAKNIAIRAINFKFGTELETALKQKLSEESQLILSYRAVINAMENDQLKREISSRLLFAERRFFYWLAAITNPLAILKTLPNIFGNDLYAGIQVQRARAFDYMDTVFQSSEMRQLLHDTFESEIPPTKSIKLINDDPWLQKAYDYVKNQKENPMDIEAKIFCLRREDLFSALPVEILELIAEQLEVHKLRKGEVLFHEGDPSDRVYIVYSGEIILYRNNEILKSMTQGVFGELGLLDNSPRTATAKGNFDCILLSLDIQEFNQLLDDIPMLSRAIIGQLLGYLRMSYKTQDMTK